MKIFMVLAKKCVAKTTLQGSKQRDDLRHNDHEVDVHSVCYSQVYLYLTNFVKMFV